LDAFVESMAGDDFVLTRSDVLFMQLLLQHFDTLTGLADAASAPVQLVLQSGPAAVAALRAKLAVGHARTAADEPARAPRAATTARADRARAQPTAAARDKLAADRAGELAGDKPGGVAGNGATTMLARPRAGAAEEKLELLPAATPLVADAASAMAQASTRVTPRDSGAAPSEAAPAAALAGAMPAAQPFEVELVQSKAEKGL
jgi:hypothetical protein